MLATPSDSQVIENDFLDDWPSSGVFQFYKDNVHAYAAIMLGIVGSVFNIFNIIVFTCKHMISPMNRILTFLAIADLLVSVLCIPLFWYEYLSKDVIPWSFQVSAEADMLYASFTYTIIYFIKLSTWFTVAMCVFRWISIAYPSQSSGLCSMRTVRLVVKVIFVVIFLFQFIEFCFFVITWANIYEIKLFGSLTNASVPEYVDTVYAVAAGVVFKIIPPIVIAVCSLRSAWILRKMRNERRNLTAESNINMDNSKGEKHMARAIFILVILSLLYFLTLMPRGISHLLFIFNEEFRTKIAFNTQELFEITILINVVFPFVVYYSICPIFRGTFKVKFMFRGNVDSSFSEISRTNISDQEILNHACISINKGNT